MYFSLKQVSDTTDLILRGKVINLGITCKSSTPIAEGCLLFKLKGNFTCMYGVCDFIFTANLYGWQGVVELLNYRFSLAGPVDKSTAPIFSSTIHPTTSSLAVTSLSTVSATLLRHYQLKRLESKPRDGPNISANPVIKVRALAAIVHSLLRRLCFHTLEIRRRGRYSNGHFLLFPVSLAPIDEIYGGPSNSTIDIYDLMTRKNRGLWIVSGSCNMYISVTEWSEK